ncbi:LPXTG cell wall anchor domain-containing protein [Kitasatospora sp. NPDC096204]|uniref:LPXTG cell wall anchor domain-containing protein n=1 Tax=Kitasatospora sp. NPDC096204 TaxID=3364094 RepID=UPI0037F197FE
MRTSVITRFAKNDRALSGRRRIAVLAATTVLAGGVQFLATDTAWACGDSADDAPAVTAPAKAAPKTTASATEAPAADHQGSYQAGFHMTPANQTITAGGPKVEIGISVTNFTGAPYQNISGLLGMYNPASGGLDTKDVTIEVASAGGWKPVKLVHGGCDPSVYAVPSAANTAPRLENGRAVNFLYRVGLSANASKDTTSLVFVASAKAAGFPEKGGESRTFHVAHTAAPAPTAKPTAPAEPKPTTSAKPKPTAPAKDTKAPEPAADTTKDAAPTAEAPKAPTAAPATAAPATTAPAGTPELAHTGSSATNTFLAVGSAAFLALGAGVLIAVRRLRPQR